MAGGVINFAHRGASAYAPENTFAAFYLGLSMGADGIETDVQRTRDGVLVLFHDDDMERVTGAAGRVSDRSLDELLALDAGRRFHPGFAGEKIVMFQDFLRYLGSKPIHLDLEFKRPGIEAELLSALKSARVRDRVVLTSFAFRDLEAVRRLDRDIPIGFLTERITPEVLDRLAGVGALQICPNAQTLQRNEVVLAHTRGFKVRAWGVKDETVMHHALACGVDGMTVNFPDKLAAALGVKPLPTISPSSW